MDERRLPAPEEEALAAALAAAGAAMTVDEVRDLVEGVLAAPEGPDPDEWMRLVAPDPGPELVRALSGFRDALRRARAERAPALADPQVRLAAFRRELARRGLDGFIVPRGDEHLGEWVPPRAERLAWLTGFTGSAGIAIVLAGRAVLFVDGRYTLQAEAQCPHFEIRHLIEEPPAKWIESTLSGDLALGYDPWLHSEDQATALRRAAEAAGIRLVPCETNPVDAVWGADQPPPPLAPVRAHPRRFAGVEAAEKRAEVAATLAGKRADAVVLAAPDSIAWLLNIRGGDVPYAPLPLSFAILRRDGTVEFFCDPRKLLPGVERHLGDGVAIRPPGEFDAALDRLGAEGRRVQVDPATTAAHVFERLRAAGADVVRGRDPCALPKARKNEVELAGARAAHLRDGAALTRFLAWLADAAAGGRITESEAAARLASFRAGGEHYRGPSFETIAGAGPNGAVVHYRVTPETDRPLEPGTLFLVDSGGQYLDGTTDVTRTVAIGRPGDEMREHFTRVLQGHIALATARFPAGTTGAQLDALARRALWQAGLDYDHGTGHGVGSYLSVHEGPQRISKAGTTVALEAGMIVSNEPGYYREGAYGIRIENLVAVVADGDGPDGKRFFRFETLTLAPIDLALVVPEMLTRAEADWLDDYHRRVRAALAPLVDGSTRRWLEAATRPVVRRSR